jgi:hypothetical protein
VEFKSLIKRAFYFENSPVRIIGIMDYKRQDTALGDTTIFFEQLLILKEKYDADFIDICVVDDSDMSENPDSKKNWALQIFPLIPSLNQVYEFNHRNDYNRFRLNNFHKNVHYPNRSGQLQCDTRPIYNYYNNKGSLPKMSADKSSIDWAKLVIKEHVGSKKLIVVHIRNTMSLKNPQDFSNMVKGKTGAALRNSNLPEWQRFFEKLDRDKYQVICICSKDEIIPLWRENNLVLFSKDLGANIMKEFALIQCSYLSLFPGSGMFQFGLFSDTPSIVYNMAVNYWKKKRDPIYQLNGVIEDFDQFIYQSDYQKLVWELDTFKTINLYFNELVKKLKRNNYDDEYFKKIQISEKVIL